MNLAYPNEFMPWELANVPKGFWTTENKIKAFKWLVKTKLGNDKERVKTELNYKLLKDNGLKVVLNEGLYNIVNLAYPNEFMPWELGTVQVGYWSKAQNRVVTVKWLVKNKLDNKVERVQKEFNGEFLKNNGLSNLASYGIFNLINEAYPKRFTLTDIYGDKVYHYINNDAYVHKVVSWIIKNQLNNRVESLNEKILIENGLRVLINKYSIDEIKQIVYKYSKNT